MNVLIFAIEAGRFGPSRLPQVLSQAGLGVSVLCPADNLLAHSAHVAAHFVLCKARSERALTKALVTAIAQCQPQMIIPADEQVVALLQSLVWRPKLGGLPRQARDLILRSLGDPRQFDAMLLKSQTVALAKQVGVATPASATVQSADDAVLAAQAIGYPVYVKQSFSWAGRGVALCHDDDAVRAAFGTAPGLAARAKSAVRRALGRGWYPTQTSTDVQASIAGDPSFYCALAWQGKLIAGYSGKVLALAYPNGPSTEVLLHHDARMAQAAEKMVAALGCTGFIAFDFMTDAQSGEPLLIECNPRLVPVHHLGGQFGVNLGTELATLLQGDAPRQTPLKPEQDFPVLLFPHSLDTARHKPGTLADIPHNDPGLIHYVTGAINSPAAQSGLGRLRAFGGWLRQTLAGARGLVPA